MTLKYADDLSLLQQINLGKHTLKLQNSVVSFLTNFKKQTGHGLDYTKVELTKEIERIAAFTRLNKMVLNKKKTQVEVFNRSRTN